MDNVRKSETPPDSEIMACSLDGVNVLLNRPGKKKGRPLERPSNESATTSSSSSYKNAMCGSITHYNIAEENGGKTPVRIGSKYIARMPEERYPIFKREFEKELKAAIPAQSVAKLVITDAHKSISGYLKDNPEVYKRMIAAYIIGYPVTPSYLAANPGKIEDILKDIHHEGVQEGRRQAKEEFRQWAESN